MQQEFAADNVANNTQLSNTIQEIIQAFPLTERTCLYFYYHDSLSFAQIAEKMAISENDVNYYITQACNKIQEELDRRGEKEGLRLWMASPMLIVPVLKMALQSIGTSTAVAAGTTITAGATASTTAGTMLTAPIAQATASAATTGTATATAATVGATKSTATTTAATTAAAIGTTGTATSTITSTAAAIKVAAVSAASVFIAGGVITTTVLFSTGDLSFGAGSAPAVIQLVDYTNTFINEITKHSLHLGSGGFSQTISIEPGQIRNFTYTKISAKELGVDSVYNCDFILDKGIVIFDVTAIITCEGSSVDDIQGVSIFAAISSTEIEGTWTGQYTATQGETKLDLNITSVAQDGTLSAIFNFSALPTNPDVPTGSYTMTGYIDPYTLQVTLTGNEWIVKPETYVFADLYGYLNVAEIKIEGNVGGAFGSGYTFSVSR